MIETVLNRSLFATMSPEDQQAYYVEHGFVLLPGIVSPRHMERIADEVSGSPRFDFTGKWPGPALEALITNPKLLGPLRRCYGEDLRFFKAVYEEWRDRNDAHSQLNRQPLHRDYSPAPENGDYRNSCMSWTNVGHYFIDLDVDEGPLYVVPGSHKLAWTRQGDMLESYADDARIILAKAGDAVMFHNLTTHAGASCSRDARGRARSHRFDPAGQRRWEQ